MHCMVGLSSSVMGWASDFWAWLCNNSGQVIQVPYIAIIKQYNIGPLSDGNTVSLGK